MRIVSSVDKITIFIYKNEVIDDINDYMKKLILKLKKKYHLDIFGFYKVNIYKNNKIGMIIDLLKEDDIDFFTDLVDLKIKVYDDSNMYLRFNDYFFREKKKVYVINNNFYMNIDKLSNKDFFSMIEFCSVIYGDELEKLKEKLIVYEK